MAVNIITSNTFKGAFLKVLELIKEKDKKDRLGSNNIIIAPDRFTLSLEKLFLEAMPENCSFNTEILSFSRLAVRLINDTRKFLSPEGAVMLMRKASEKAGNSLRLYSSSSLKQGFDKQIFAVISQIRNSNYTSEQLAEASKKLKGKVKDKALDIACIYSEYLKLLEENYIDTTSRLKGLADIIADSAFISRSDIYVTDFYSFNAMELRLVELLMKNALNFTVALIDKGKDANYRIYPFETVKNIENIALSSGEKVNCFNLKDEIKPPFSVIEKELFGYSSCPKENGKGISIHSAADRENEIVFIAEKIKNYILKGDRYKDFAIVCPDIEEYEPLFKDIFERFAVPYFIDKKFPLSNLSHISYITDALNTVLSDFEKNAVYKFVLSPHFNCEYAFDFINYCDKYNINYSMFKKEFVKGQEDEIIKAEKVRLKLIGSLKPLFIKSKIPFSEFYKAVSEFIKLNDLENEENRISDIQKNDGFIENAEASLRGLEKFTEILDEQKKIFSSSVDTFKNFYEILKTAVSSAKLSFIPLKLDSVFIGEPNESRYTGVKYLFVTGATEGSFPQSGNDDGILTVREIDEFKKCGISVEPNFKTVKKENKFNIIQLLIKPEKELFISYPLLDGSGQKTAPSAVITELLRLFDLKVISFGQFPENTEDFAGLCATRKNAEYMLAKRKGEMKEGYYSKNLQNFYDALYTVVGFKEKDRTPFSEYVKFDSLCSSVNLSSTELETYFDCPYKHFMKYALKLKEKEEFGLKALDRGSLVHTVLEKFFKQIPHNATENQAYLTAENIAKSTVSSGSYKYIFEQLKGFDKIMIKECSNICVQLYNNFSKSKFEIKDTECPFEAVFENIKIKGKIDRIDILGKNAIVIDYKTSSNIKSSLKDIYYGNKIQLYIYLNALKDYNAVGAFYLPVNDKYVKFENKDERLRLKGQIADDTEIVRNLDTTLCENNLKSSVFPVSLTVKDGVFKVRAEENVLSVSEIDKVKEYVVKLARKASSEMNKGYIARKPHGDGEDDDTNSCAFCSYKNICLSEKTFRIQNKKVKNAITDSVRKEE